MMLYQYMRIFDSDNGTLSDVSLENQDEGTNLSFDLVAGEDYIYIGKYYPFNNFFLQLGTANDEAANLSIEYWDGQQWRNAVDILDGTKVSGVPLARSGVVQFSTNDEYGWYYVGDPSDTSGPTELQYLSVYNLYWLRLSYSQDLNALTKVKRIAYAFTQSQQLNELDTTINNFLDTFETGKTDWNDQIMTASMHVVRDLQGRGLVRDHGQILLLQDVSLPTDWKTLEMIYYNLGGDYSEKYKNAQKMYKETLKLERYSFDMNDDARLDRRETTGTVRSLTR